jgi:hypothetical protein
MAVTKVSIALANSPTILQIIVIKEENIYARLITIIPCQKAEILFFDLGFTSTALKLATNYKPKPLLLLSKLNIMMINAIVNHISHSATCLPALAS